MVISYDETSASAFEIGDVVEATLSFVVFHRPGGKTFMLPVLRVLALLDTTVRQVRSLTFKFTPSNIPLRLRT